MKRIFLLLLFFTFSIYSFAQDETDERALRAKSSLVKINFLTPGVEYEGAISAYNTINVSFDVGVQVAIIDFGVDTETEVFFRPIFGGQFRHYYNFKKRHDDGRNTLNNSANFVGVATIFMLEPFNQSDIIEAGSVFAIGPVWGINRTYETGFSLSLYLGVGYQQEKYDESFFDTSGVGILGGLKLGFVTNRDR